MKKIKLVTLKKYVVKKLLLGELNEYDSENVLIKTSPFAPTIDIYFHTSLKQSK